MPMSEADRVEATRRLAKEIFPPGETATLDTDELKAAIDAIDDTLETVMSALNIALTIEGALNAALPEPFRTTSTTAQKAATLATTVNKKFIG